MIHQWIWMDETRKVRLGVAGSVCITCGRRAYGWGGFMGECVIDA